MADKCRFFENAGNLSVYLNKKTVSKDILVGNQSMIKFFGG